MRASAALIRVLLPIPGEPPISTTEPGTRPPPSTRSSSSLPVRRRSQLAALDLGERDRLARLGRPRRRRRRPGAPSLRPTRPIRLRIGGLFYERVPLPAAGAAAHPAQAGLAAGGTGEAGDGLGHGFTHHKGAGRQRLRAWRACGLCNLCGLRCRHARVPDSAPSPPRTCSSRWARGRPTPSMPDSTADTPEIHAALRAGRRRGVRPRASLGRPCPRRPRLPRLRAPRPRPARPPAAAAHDGDYWRFADWLAPVLRRALAAGAAPTTAPATAASGRIYHNSLLLTTHAVAALAGHHGPCRNDEPGARAGAAAVRLAALERARRLAGGRPPVPQPGLGREHGHARRRDGQVDRPEGGRGADVRVAGARRAAAARTRPST